MKQPVAILCYTFLLNMPLLLQGAEKDYFNYPKQQVLAGYYHNSWAHGSLPKLPKPLFWGSKHHATSGGTISYLYTLYHTQKYFSIHGGVAISNWNLNASSLYALSGFFELRLWIFHTKSFNPYLMYSIAGPTVLSSNHIQDSKLGGYFLFQDYMGVGVLLGQTHKIMLEVKTLHYSNGDLAVYNQGLQIPWLFSIGYVFSR